MVGMARRKRNPRKSWSNPCTRHSLNVFSGRRCSLIEGVLLLKVFSYRRCSLIEGVLFDERNPRKSWSSPCSRHAAVRHVLRCCFIEGVLS